MTYDTIFVWLIILVVLVVIELATMGLTTIWFAGGALVAMILSMFNAPVFLQFVVFLVVSIVMLYYTRPLAAKYFNKDRIKTNAEGLIGKQAIVTSVINNLQGEGHVTINGMEWSAKSVTEEHIIAEGTVVRVVAIAGVKLIVEERKEVI
ncbi:MAG: NfeD family protein [Lachnospiraceae bacterium]